MSATNDDDDNNKNSNNDDDVIELGRPLGRPPSPALSPALLDLSARADVNHANSGFGITALTRAAFYGHAEVIKVLIANKADVNKAPTDQDAQQSL